MTRPVTTTSAPARRHSAMPKAPRYAFAVSAPGTSTASPSTCPTLDVEAESVGQRPHRIGQPGRVQAAGVGDEP